MTSTAPIDAVITHHADGFRSGVARFNEILAERLDVPLVRIDNERVSAFRAPLLSFKITEMGEADRALVDALLFGADSAAGLLLHDWGGSDFERRCVAGAERVWGANEEIGESLRDVRPDAGTLWAPGLLSDLREIDSAEISVFSFGMAHKIRSARFKRLGELLEASGRSYALYVSSANHATTTMQDAQSVYEDMHELFPDRLYFMGNLSDVAVYNQLVTTTFFASFFPDGVRANNTSVNAAMEHGCVVITNLDERSPSRLVHMENVLDIDRMSELPTDPETLERVGKAAAAAADVYSWDRLVAALR